MANAAVTQHVEVAPSLTAGQRYMPGLDVLRGLAILLVLMQHGLATHHDDFARVGNPLLMLIYEVAARGYSGVHLFFVLSGFLITGILLDSRGKPEYYREFYLRRVLRIVPAYLLLLTVLKLMHWTDWRYTLICLVYLANMCSPFHVKPQYGPLWSLSVEEQFYLVWPVVVRKLSHRALLVVSVALVVLTPLLRLALLYGPKATSDWPHKTWGVADFFAAGAILAVGIRTPRLLRIFERAALPLLGLGAALVLIQAYVPYATEANAAKLQAAFSLTSFLVIWTACVLLAFLHPRLAAYRGVGSLVFLADISYGLYLCHEIVFEKINALWVIAEPTGGRTLAMLLARFAVETLAAIGVAWVSRRTLEAFFLRMKRKPTIPVAV